MASPTPWPSELLEPPAWLASAVDPARLAEALRTHVPALRDRLLWCEPKRLRLRDESGAWSGSFVLRLADGEQTVRAVTQAPGDGADGDRRVGSSVYDGNGASFLAPGWRCGLPELG